MPTKLIPDSWMPNARFDGIVMHWTGGNHIAGDYDKGHYHFGVDGPGTGIWRGVDLRHNAKGVPLISGKYAAHTFRLNAGWIGFTLACMGSTKFNPATERNFVNIAYPMTKAQWDMGIKGAAELCIRYNIPVQRPTPQNPRGVLSHAEVQDALGIKQAGKWDFTRLSWKPELQGAREVGDFMRAQIREQVALMQNVQHFASMPEDELLPPEQPEYETAAEVAQAENPALPNPPMPKPAQEPLSGFRTVLGWVTGIITAVGSTLAGFGSWLAMLKPEVLIAIVVTLAVVGLVIFALIWLFPRPIVIEKER